MHRVRVEADHLDFGSATDALVESVMRPRIELRNAWASSDITYQRKSKTNDAAKLTLLIWNPSNRRIVIAGLWLTSY